MSMENSPAEKETLDALLRKVQGTPPRSETTAAVFEDLGGAPGGHEDEPRRPRAELLKGVHLKVRAELGRSRLLLRDALQIGPGSVIDLEKLADEPVELYVNDLLFARGEVLVVNDSFCIRVTEVLSAGGREEEP